MKLRVAMVGIGRWGSTLLRALLRHPDFEVVALVDSAAAARAAAACLVPSAAPLRALDELAPGMADAAVIATPSQQHAAGARTAVRAGLDVLVEKPVALSARDVVALQRAAQLHRRVVMVGHVMRYHPAALALVERVSSGFIGELRHFAARRFTQSGSPDPLWTLITHDIATLRAMDRSAIESVSASEHADVVRISLRLESGTTATFEATTTAHEPQRISRARGTRGALCFDELAAPASLRASVADETEQLVTAGGDALDAQLDHFAGCVRQRSTPRTSLADGLAIVQALERAEQALLAAPEFDVIQPGIIAEP